LIKRVACADFGYEWVKKNRTPEWIAEKEQQGVFVCAMDLSVKDHVDTLITFGKYVDNSISKTINLANDYPYEDFDGMFRQLWKDGVRGVTTYRAGTMSAVLEVKKPTQTVKQEQDDFFKEWESHNGNVVQESIKLPTEYPMHGYIVRSENKKWYFHAAFKDRACKKPFAVFVHTNATEPNVTTYNALDLLEELAYTENVPECHIERTKTMCKTQTNVAKLTRMVALLLRHNVKIIKIVQTLESVECNVTSFIYAFKKFMMKFVPNNTETGEKCPSCSGTILFTEGCVQCKDCGWQKC
jgi:ribonucleoside-diphosphate reductase alpha chain